jgi:hypothetical protein
MSRNVGARAHVLAIVPVEPIVVNRAASWRLGI